MDNISIYSPEGVLLHEAPMSRQNKIVNKLTGEHYIEIAFNVASSMTFVAGSYIIYNRWHYFLKKDAYPEPISGDAGYKYVLKFYAPQHRMEQRLMKWFYSPNKEVTFTLTATLDTFAQLLVDNMNAKIADEAAEFRWVYNTQSHRNDTREVIFDGVSCWEAMVRIAEAFGVEYWLTDINKPEMGGVPSVNELQLNFGKLAIGDNWEEIREGEVVTRFPASKRGEDANFGTRYYIYGGTKNIPEGYYERVEGGVTNHISEKRLHLPDGTPYIDVLNGEVVNTLPASRVIERVIFLDDVFPKNESTITAIEEHEEELIEGRQDKSYSISSTDTGFGGSDEDVLGTLGVTFTSGALSGSSFDVRWNKPFDGKFHITPRVEGSTGSDQIVIPNDYITPAVGDKFVLTGIKLPEPKIKEAENELLSEGRAKAKEYGADTNVYDCKTDPVYCQNNKKNYRLGTRVKLIGGAFGEKGRQSRIQGYEKALYNEYDATYSIGDNATYSRVAAIAKGYANNSGRIIREETTKWQNKANITIQSAGNNADLKNKVNTLIGDDTGMSARDIAEAVLAGASTGGDIDFSSYLKKTEAEEIYAQKDVVYTKGEVDTKINEAVRINGEELSKKADKATVDGLSASIDGKADKSSVTEISNRVDTKADKSAVQTLESQINQKVDITAYNTKVDALAASIAENKSYIDKQVVHLEGHAEEVANDAETKAKEYADSIVATTKSDLTQYIGDEIHSAVTKLDTQFEGKVNAVDTKSRVEFVTPSL